MYKVLHNNMVIDLLTEVEYVRYLPKLKRIVMTDSQSANGVMGSDHNTIYHLFGRPNTFDVVLKSVVVVRITEDEFSRLSMEFSISKQENIDLKNKMDVLEERLQNQTDLLQAILEKLS